MNRNRTAFKQWNSVSLVLTLLFAFLTYIIVSGGSLHHYIASLDLSIESSVLAVNTVSIFPILLFFTDLVNPIILIPLQLCVLIILYVVHRERVGVIFTLSLIGGELISLIVKYSIERARPINVVTTVSRIGSSFPSNHALIATVFYGFLGYLFFHVSYKFWQKILITIVSLFLIIAIGLSRVLLGVHWMSDVLGGWLMGGAILSAVIASLAAFDRWWKRVSHPHQKYILTFILCTAIILGILTSYYFVANPAEFYSILYA